jgi:membrane protease YdiL (CAAX protease family)
MATIQHRIGREVVVLASLFVFSILAHFVTDVTASGNSAEKGPHHFDVSKLFATYAGSPVVEEYIFRVVLCSKLASRSTNVAFISGVSSFLFSAIHLVNLFGNASGLYLAFQLAVAALVGATYSVIYLDSRSIVPTTILHILNNASSRALSPDQPQELLFTLAGLTQGASFPDVLPSTAA